MIASADLDFSFSGLKTAVLVLVRRLELDDATRADVAASFQAAIVDVLAAKSGAALDMDGATPTRRGRRRRCQSGAAGAAARSAARRAARGCSIRALEFCTDNGAMIALVGALAPGGGGRAARSALRCGRGGIWRACRRPSEAAAARHTTLPSVPCEQLPDVGAMAPDEQRRHHRDHRRVRSATRGSTSAATGAAIDAARAPTDEIRVTANTAAHATKRRQSDRQAEREQDARSRGDALAALEAEEDGIEVTQEGGEARQRHHARARTDLRAHAFRQPYRDHALQHIAAQA